MNPLFFYNIIKWWSKNLTESKAIIILLLALNILFGTVLYFNNQEHEREYSELNVKYETLQSSINKKTEECSSQIAANNKAWEKKYDDYRTNQEEYIKKQLESREAKYQEFVDRSNGLRKTSRTLAKTTSDIKNEIK